MLFLLGALGGFVFAMLATAALERLPLPANVPVALELSPDLRVLAFALGVSLVTGLLFGLAPALQAARRDITSRLRDDGARQRRHAAAHEPGLIVGQLALSLVLLVAAGLFIRALDRGAAHRPRVRPGGRGDATLEPEAWGYDEATRRSVLRRAAGARRGAAGGRRPCPITGRLPLMMGSSADDIAVDGTPTCRSTTPAWTWTTSPRCGCRWCRAARRRHRRRARTTRGGGQRDARGGSGPTAARSAARSASATRSPPSSASPATRSTPRSTRTRRRSSISPRAGVAAGAGAAGPHGRPPGQLAPAIQDAMLSIDPALPRPRVTTLGRQIRSCCCRSASPPSSPARWAGSACCRAGMRCAIPQGSEVGG